MYYKNNKTCRHGLSIDTFGARNDEYVLLSIYNQHQLSSIPVHNWFAFLETQLYERKP